MTNMTQFREALITGSWRCGSTVLNRSLMQLPGIFGWIEETSLVKLTAPPAEWQEGQWVRSPLSMLGLHPAALLAYPQLPSAFSFAPISPPFLDRKTLNIFDLL
jgi:hypothetical protein